MFVLLSSYIASHGVAEALRDYYGYRGTACYLYDYRIPSREAYEGAMMALYQYNLDYTLDETRQLYEKVEDWLLPRMPEIAKKNIYDITDKWVDHKMFFVAVVHNIMPHEVAALTLEPSFKVYVKSEKDFFDGSAVGTGFDLKLCSENSTATQMAESIGAALHRRLFGDMAHSPIQDESSADAQ